MLWKTWKNKFNVNKRVITIQGFSKDCDITDEFANFFKTSFASNSVEKDKEIDNAFYLKFEKYKQDYNMSKESFVNQFHVDTVMIEDIIQKLKHGKAYGADELMAEHLQFAHPIVCVVLNKLFNLMLSAKYVPDAFGVGIIIPIPKNSNACGSHKIEDFRRITISSVVSKVFEHCVLLMIEDYLYSSSHQFGFKKGRGCRDAIFALNETVDYFVSGVSTVNLCTIDVTKAFDRLNHNMLFIKFMQRKIPIFFIYILMDWYRKCVCQIKWQNLVSRVISVNRGVRQGGILSPFLFAVYVDDALQKLIDTGYGCNYYGFNIGALMYADDLVLICASVVNLQKLIMLTEKLFDELNLKINISKCAAMRIGSRCNVMCTNLELSNGTINWSHEIKYLGLTFQQASYLKINVHSCKVKFFQSFNSIYAKIGTTNNPDTIVQLMKSNCLSVLLYNLEALQLTRTNINNLKFPLHRAIMKIFHVKDTQSVLWCQYYMHVLPVESTLDLRKRKFYFKLSKSYCPLLQFLYSKSASIHLSLLNQKYGVDVNNSCSNGAFFDIVWEKFLDDLPT